MASTSHKNNKGQSGLELVMLTSFALLAFSVVYLSFIDKDIDTISEKINSLARKTTDDIAFDIRVAVTEGDGYEKNFTIADSFYGINYIVNITDYLVFITVNDRSFLSHIPIENITGTVIPGKNTIICSGGKIYANQ
ncbi:MAG: hypothetical protein KAI53_01290 [Candidatus Aenigmarchaeota archaeon]|nr:hypothetical protein [Candidatus Aenigmarchaeota archaeon]